MKLAVLTGGVGGAKLVLGLVAALPDADITAIVNTGDDFVHLGLSISPDIDTLLYTLSGKSNVEQGWGRAGESWQFMAALRELGGEDWFNLGDGDLALHVLRSMRLKRGEPLSRIVADFARRWDIGARILPMTDNSVATIVLSDEGELPFQEYFVARRCEPLVKAVRFAGAENARAAPGVVDAIVRADAVIISPSNPYLSIDPVLAIGEIRDALSRTSAARVAVSPIIGDRAVKGPTAKLMTELGLRVSAATVAAHYDGLIDAMLIDEDDAPQSFPVAVARAPILMRDLADKKRVALATLALADSCRPRT